ncbi:hypothetical protein ASJ81_16415 [Methanosarcina spelaei]|uniref:Card1 CARF domain-containing protein n=1 Tax=Methanosarcina spelaei TaxID=1036679 RepID=A0A2A2HWA8_9EURY|nr:hypothetical protein [Methanosarcina spelaei]PAV13801.1 hypothetical protein ASJ81_16415 [Methanosarcina spelaei]
MDKKIATKNESDKFAEYRSDYLFLLIGTNPLPNYVAYHLLAKPSSHIIFIHTSKTDKIANNLITVLNIPSERWTKIPVNESDSRDIYKKITEYSKGKQKLGLNYTGGTKAMAVNAYKAVLDADQDSVFSYLDARSLELVIDERDSSSKRIPASPSIKSSIEELFSLHGYKIDNKREVFMPEICEVLANDLFVEFRKWCDEKLRSKDLGKILNKSKLKTVILPVVPPFEILANFWEGCSTLGELAKKWKTNVENLANWLDGNWLEDYTLLAFQEVAEECKIHDHILGAKFNYNKFELDVAILRGYELFVVSCTTASKKSIVKQKLFEAYVRGQQLGGDEAKIGVVCFASDRSSDASPEIIKKEIKEEWHLENKFRVFGAEQIPNLPIYLKEWLTS